MLLEEDGALSNYAFDRRGKRLDGIAAELSLSLRWQPFGLMVWHYVLDPLQNPPPATARTFPFPASVRSVVAYLPRWVSTTVAAFPVATTAPQLVPHDDRESRDTGVQDDRQYSCSQRR